MCHHRSLNNRINRIHECSLRIVYKDYNLTYEELLIKSGSVKIHHRNLQILATKIYKVINNLSPLLMKEIFPIKDTKYNLRNENTFISQNVRSVHYSTETISFLGPTSKRDKKSTLSIFKHKIKLWVPEKCQCRLCKKYMQILDSFSLTTLSFVDKSIEVFM